jgi:hypothetical protein
VLDNIVRSLAQYQEEALDRLVMPHPFLGLLTIREMMYLMIFHAPHHLAQVRYQLDQKEKQSTFSTNQN